MCLQVSDKGEQVTGMENTEAESHCGWKTGRMHTLLCHWQRLRTNGVYLEHSVLMIMLFIFPLLFLSQVFKFMNQVFKKEFLKFQEKNPRKDKKFTSVTAVP